MATHERRFVQTEFEVRTTPTGGAIVEGHGAMFWRLSSNLGGFVEQVSDIAFDRTLGDNPDVRALINHEPSAILGRTRSGTLRLAKDSQGLHYEIDMPERQDARDLLVSMGRKDITQSSFGFYVMSKGEEWGETDQGMPLRTLTAVSLHNGDVSPVTYPAYEDSDSGIAGRALRSLAAIRGLDPEAVALAAAAGGLREIILGATPDEVVDLGATRSALAVARARLELDKLRHRDLG